MSFRQYCLAFHNSAKTEFKENKSRRYISVELEISNADSGNEIDAVNRRWQTSVVEDSSIESAHGFELNTQPCNGDRFIAQITELCEALTKQNAETTVKCGFHVHIDARDFNHWDVRRLIKVYAAIEDALFQCVPKSRRTSGFCIRCGPDFLAAIDKPLTKSRKKETKKGVFRAIYSRDTTYGDLFDTANNGRSFKKLKKTKYVSSRYTALNLHSWLYRGSVECRLAAGTISAEKVINWALLWAAILDFAYKTAEKTIDNMPTDSWACLMMVCPADTIKTWLAHRREIFSR